MKTTAAWIMALAALTLLTGCHTLPKPGLSSSAPPVRLLPEVWKASWSPDGHQVVYVQGSDGLAILNLKTAQTSKLTPNGKDPTWSPGGRWIAFVREPSRDQWGGSAGVRGCGRDVDIQGVGSREDAIPENGEFTPICRRLFDVLCDLVDSLLVHPRSSFPWC